MKIELDDLGRLKVALSKEDLSRLDLRFEQIKYQDEKVRALLWELMKDAGHLSGFDYKPGGRLLIEVFPAPDFGCLIYFTVLEQEREAEQEQKDNGIGQQATSDQSAVSCRGLRPRSRLKMKKASTEPYIFEFAASGDLLSAVEKLKPYAGQIGKSELYRWKDRYRLVLFPDVDAMSALPLLSEYGAPTGSGRPAAAFTREHGELIAGRDAVREIGRWLGKQ